eukprot:TRINITY_DN22664_c0_g1_i1.p1 TRINITY_DN22664_c0_g1~~TRINITY_DN22664_c0_g1_i1.p1  ORF type:complete len:471 (-),score=96.95 TRINITY_DN22664_c0_g1_i1:113-1495(-)
MKRGQHILAIVGLVILVEICVYVAAIEIPIKYIPPHKNLVVIRRAFGTDGIAPAYEYRGGSWAIGLNLGSSSGPIFCNLDSGSFDLFVAGQGCSNCVPTPPIFYTPTSNQQVVSCSSTTCNTQGNTRNTCTSSGSCQTTVVYGDGSGVTATVVRDVVGIPGLTTSILGFFGAITSTKNTTSGGPFLSTGQGGIIGCAYGTGSSFPNGAGQNLLDYLANVNNQPNIFSLCLNSAGPWMSFGENYYGKNNFFWTPVNYKPYFGFTLNNVLLNYASTTSNGGGTSLGLSQAQYNTGRPFIDSGTTLIYLETNLWNTFYGALQSACNSGVNLVGVCGQTRQNSIFNRVFQLTTAQVAAYPTVQFIISCTGNGATCSSLNVPPTSWIRSLGQGRYTGGIQTSTLSILGSVFMQNYHVVFDKTRDYIGFAPQSTCNLDGVVSNVTNKNPNAGARLKTPFSLVRDLI